MFQWVILVTDRVKRVHVFWLLVFLATISVITFLRLDGGNLVGLAKPRESPINIIFTKVQTGSTKPPLNEYLNIVPMYLRENFYLKGTIQVSKRNLTIYLHYRGDYITDTILNVQKWEPFLVGQFEDYIKFHVGVQVLDLGCNVGVFTLVAAALGCKVVAVDANPNNTARLVQSLMANGLEGHATVLLNAISNERKTYHIDLVPKNIGASHIKEAKRSNSSVNAIFMDDLVPLFDVKETVAIKMDLETTEIIALKRASVFFAQRKVGMVLMEWEYIKKMADIKFVLDFFAARRFSPWGDSTKSHRLKVVDYLKWPSDVFWIN